MASMQTPSRGLPSEDATSSPPIKVRMVGLPPLLTDMATAAFGADADFEVVASEGFEAPLATDVLLTARTEASVEQLLWASPQLHAFVIGPDARAVRIRMCPVREVVGELSFAELRAVIKTSIANARRLRRDSASTTPAAAGMANQ